MESPALGSDLSIGTLWFWSVGILFVVTLVAAVWSCVVPTFRSEDVREWKGLWNRVELVWIVLAGFGVAGAIIDSWSTVRQDWSEFLLDDAASDVEIAKNFASHVLAAYCVEGSSGEELCQLMVEVRDFEAVTDYRAMRSTMFRIWKLDFVFPDGADGEDLQKSLHTVERRFSDATLSVQDAAFEMSRALPLQNRLWWFPYFWPHFLSAGFALRLARAFAAFAF